VVVVTLNHRLGILGYLDLSGLGDHRFADSVNVGMLDIVEALRWVRENIGNFGGDPENVTIFGESSGGFEVSMLMNMPVARGLFHRAIVQSGSALKLNSKDQAAQRTDAVLKGLGLERSKFQKIQALPVDQIIEAAVAAGGARPWVDGEVIPTDPFDPGAPKISAQVPMLIGTVLNEASSIGNAEIAANFEDVQKLATARFGDKAAGIIQMARQLHPQAGPVEIYTLIDLDAVVAVAHAVLQAQRKCALGSAPAYMYLFAWHTPVLDGRPLAYHQSEIPFVFDNTDRCASTTGGGPEARELAAKVSEAWIQFARGGNPAHSGLPDWPAFTSDNGATMVFDNDCKLQSYPDRQLHDLIAAAMTGRKS
jgi:para-nitrobenzyl esterase